MGNELYNHTLAERVAILETQMSDLKEIKEKLEQLVQLKAQGMGALTLVSILVGSGAIGLIATLWAVMRGRGHI